MCASSFGNPAPTSSRRWSPATSYASERCGCHIGWCALRTCASCAPASACVPDNGGAPVERSPLTTTYNHVAHVAPMTTYNHVAPMTTYSHVAPMTTTYNNIVASPVTYTAHVATPLASNGAHAVAATTAGWTHSANVGVCTNVHGQQVAC